MDQFNDISTIQSRPRLKLFIRDVRSLYYRLVRWIVWVFRRSFAVFVQYFRRVLKNVDNEQVRKPAICDCDVFVCKHWKELVGLPLGELKGNRVNFCLRGPQNETADVYQWQVFTENSFEKRVEHACLGISTGVWLMLHFRDGPLGKWWGWGIFRWYYFFSRTACAGIFFFMWNPLHDFFF